MKKGRKWDDPVVRVRPRCLEAARDVAKKINARLIAEGILKPIETTIPVIENSKTESSLTPDHPYTCEIDINDIPMSCRNLLTRTVTQEDISKVSGAKVSTKGRFMTSVEKYEAKLSGEKALHLSIQGLSQASVDLAVQRITSIISSTCNIPPTSLSIISNNSSSSGSYKSFLLANASSSLNFTPQTLAFVQDKLFVGLEHAPPSFDVKSKLLGPNGTYLQHIQSETGSKVLLRGRGSGFNEPTSGREAFEPMHIYIQHSNHVGLQQARSLAQSLLHTVQQEYAVFQQQLAFMPSTMTPQGASHMMGAGGQPTNYPMWASNNTVGINNNINNNVMYPQQQSSMLPTVYPTMTSTNSISTPMGMMTSLPPIPYSFPIDNFIPKPTTPAKRPPLLQTSPLMPVYNYNTQISSFSAVQDYYQHHLQAGPATEACSIDASSAATAAASVVADDGAKSNNHNSETVSGKSENGCHQNGENNPNHGSVVTNVPPPPPPRRRFQEKEVEATAATTDQDGMIPRSNAEELKTSTTTKQSPPMTEHSSSVSITEELSKKSHVIPISKLLESRITDRDIMPPPAVASVKAISINKRKQHSKSSEGEKSKDTKSSSKFEIPSKDKETLKEFKIPNNTKTTKEFKTPKDLKESPKNSKDMKLLKEVKNLKENKTESKRSSLSPSAPKKLRGALKSVAACYGSDSEEDSDT